MKKIFEFKIRKHFGESIFKKARKANSPFHHLDWKASIVTICHSYNYYSLPTNIKLDFLATKNPKGAVIFKSQLQQQSRSATNPLPVGLLEKLFILSFFALSSLFLSQLEMSSIPFGAFSAKSVHDVVKMQLQQEEKKHSAETGSRLVLTEGATKPKRKYTVFLPK